MQFLEICGAFFLVYYVVYVILWLILDCNVALWWKVHFGVPISTLQGKIVWITGASSGIGKALAVNLAHHGVKIVLSARRTDLLEIVKDECLKKANGLLTSDDILTLPLDVLKLQEHDQCLKKVLNHFGRLDILVNNAGRSQRATWENIDVQVDRDLFELDVFSSLHLSRLVVRYFLQEKQSMGHIAVTSSLAGVFPVPFSATYCGAKHAINAYMLCLTLEHPSVNITIFNPGPVCTDFLKEAFTEKPHEIVGETKQNNKRLSAERCAYLYAVALANKVEVSWCGVFPINFLAYLTTYSFPLLRYFCNAKTLRKLRDGAKA